MSYRDLDPFNYMDIKPQNYKHKQNMSSDIDLITKTLENITNEWKERESCLQFIGRIVKGNQGKSDVFIKYFNTKLSSSLEIQLSDLRSTVMKEACRITSLVARELGLLVEQGITQLLTQNCLFKIAGSANQVISESAAKCILNLLRYVHSLKVIYNICEIKTMKANNVRILCAQSLVNIMGFYDTGIIVKSKNIIEETIETLLVDANAEVRSTTRKSFILYKSRFENEAKIIFAKLGKNVQKQILEDEKNFDKFNINVKYDKNANFMKNINNIIDENLNKINNQNKPKTPEFNLFKKKSSREFIIKERNSMKYSNNNKINKSTSKKKNNHKIEKKEDKKEETVKYINVDNDDIIENEDDIEEDKKDVDDSKEVNMILNYKSTTTKNKNNNKISFNKRNQIKNENDISSNNIKNEDYRSSIVSKTNDKNPKNNKKEKEEIKLSQSNNVNANLKFNSQDDKDIIQDLIVNPEKKSDNIPNTENNNNQKIPKTVSYLATERANNFESNKNISKNKVRASARVKNKNNAKYDINTHSNINKKNKILKKFNTKFEQLNSVKNFTLSMRYPNKSNNLKDNKTKVISGEKTNAIKNDDNKNTERQTLGLKKSNNNFVIKNSKTIEYHENKINNINNSENEKNKYSKKTNKINKENVERVKIDLDEEENDIEEEIDDVINMDKKKAKTRTYNSKTIQKPKNIAINDFKNKNELNKKDNKYEYDNIQDLYKELSNTTTSIENEELNNENLEQKIIFILDKLDNLINLNEKLILFQYLFNYCNLIFAEIKKFSQSTIKRYIEIHIENLKENDSNLVEQIIKNLMRMIFYLNNIFTTYDIELILKLLLFPINDLSKKNLKKLSYDLLDIIKKKCDNEELFQSVYSLLSEYNSHYDECYEFMYLLIPSCDSILKNINYFKQVFRLLCLTDVNSKKVGKIIDILYRNYRNNFNKAFEEETPNNKQQILMFMEKLNSLYYREFKSNQENISINNNNTNINNNDKINMNNNQIKSSIIQHKKKNSSRVEKKESKENDNISHNKENSSNHKNSKTNLTSNNKENNIIYNQNTKNNDNINTINTNLNGNNIISINNSNNNNIIITNKLPDDIIPNEIKLAIKNNDTEQYLLYIQKHKSYIPEFVLLLSNKKYSEVKYITTLLNFTKNILIHPDFSIDLNTCINLILKQIIYIFNTNKSNQIIEELIKNILSDMPIFLNSEKCLSSIDKYLTSETEVSTLELLILSLEDFVKKYKNEAEKINKEMKPLPNLLDYFITEIFNLLKHQNSDIRKRALYCCLEIYTVIGKEFDPFIAKIPNAQQNLIRLYIKKRIG